MNSSTATKSGFSIPATLTPGGRFQLVTRRLPNARRQPPAGRVTYRSTRAGIFGVAAMGLVANGRSLTGLRVRPVPRRKADDHGAVSIWGVTKETSQPPPSGRRGSPSDRAAEPCAAARLGARYAPRYLCREQLSQRDVRRGGNVADYPDAVRLARPASDATAIGDFRQRRCQMVSSPRRRTGGKGPGR